MQHEIQSFFIEFYNVIHPWLYFPTLIIKKVAMMMQYERQIAALETVKVKFEMDASKNQKLCAAKDEEIADLRQKMIGRNDSYLSKYEEERSHALQREAQVESLMATKESLGMMFFISFPFLSLL